MEGALAIQWSLQCVFHSNSFYYWVIAMKKFDKTGKDLRAGKGMRYTQVQREPVKFKPKEDTAAQLGRKQKKQNRPGNTRIFMNAGLIFCTIIAVTLLIFYVEKASVDSTYDKLLEEVEKAEQMATKPEQETTPEEPAETTPETSAPEDATEVPTDPPEEIFDKSKVLPKYQSLYSKNNEMFGWIEIKNTHINYPVMQSTTDNNEYLHADFFGNYLYAGIPFADATCSRNSDNIILYGHNMKNGTMFHDIMNYKDKSYWQKNPTIMFSDLTKDYTYEIVAAFYDRVYKKSEKVFKFYQFINAESKEDFDYAISQFKQKSIYDTGVDVQYGDKLITLVTCAYHVENGRFVVVARRK